MVNAPVAERPRIVVIAVLAEGSLGLLAVVFGFLLGHSPFSSLDRSPDHGLAIAWGLLATLPMLGALAIAVKWPVGPIGSLLHEVRALTHSLFESCTVAELAVIGLAAGLGEELLFRGLLQDALAVWLGAPLGGPVALLGASFVFGLAHPISRGYVVAATLSGLWLGGLLIATDSLLAPIVTHALYDLVALTYFARWSPGQGADRHGIAD